MITRRLPALALLPVLLTACSDGSSTTAAPSSTVPAASAPAPGVTLPPDALSALVPAPDEVPAGMVLVVKGSGPRDLATVAGYSSSGAGAQATAARTAAAAKLRAHGFRKAYVAQYVNTATGAVISVVASSFGNAAGATADFADDEKVHSGTPTAVDKVGAASSATIQTVPGSVAAQLLLLRFRQGTTTWSFAFQAAPSADRAVAVALATLLVQRAPA
ncbi:MAG: hypothetical protein QOD70_2915 [Frankiales bacterium]|nr:hypothetical protein [Frankiales bacterium]